MIGSAIALSRQPVAILSICRAAFSPSLPAQISSRVGTANNAVEDRIVSSVEEVFHHARHHREIFRGGEDIAVGLDRLVRAASAA